MPPRIACREEKRRNFAALSSNTRSEPWNAMQVSRVLKRIDAN